MDASAHGRDKGFGGGLSLEHGDVRGGDSGGWRRVSGRCVHGERCEGRFASCALSGNDRGKGRVGRLPPFGSPTGSSNFNYRLDDGRGKAGAGCLGFELSGNGEPAGGGLVLSLRSGLNC